MDIMDKSLFSTVSSQIPFVNYCDGNRIQMATSMIRQYMDLLEPEPPIITTFNSLIKTNTFHTQRSLMKGFIKYKSQNYIVLEYEDGSEDIFINPKYPTFIITDKKEGDEVIENELIIWHKNYDDSYCLLKFGANANVMFHSYNSYTYEDAIVMSKDAEDKYLSYYIDSTMIEIFTEKEYVDLLTDLNPGTILNKQDIIRISYISKKLTSVLYTPNERLVYNKHDKFMITDINVYVKDEKAFRNSKIYSDRFKEFVNKYNVKNKYPPEIYKKIKENYSYNSLMFIELLGYKIHTPEVGDKFANLWGNKGVVSLIEPKINLKINDNEIYNIDFVHTPIGIPSRMNPAQIIYMNFGYFLKYHIPKLINEMNDDEALKYILALYKYIDNNAYKKINKMIKILSKNNNFDNYLKIMIGDIRKNGLHMMLSSFTYNITDRIYNVLEQTNCPRYGYDNSGNKIGFGVIYNIALKHIVENKIKHRSMSTYEQKTLQPNKDSQRIGEMEMWTIASYDTPNLLTETLSIKSDDIDNKNNVIRDILLTGKSNLSEYKIKSKTFDLLKAYIKLLGFDLTIKNK